jgi:DNA-binding transcriptional MocR family regulator
MAQVNMTARAVLCDGRTHTSSTNAGEPLADYVRPSAGMFVWLKLRGVKDSFALITTKAVEKKVT